MNPDITTYGPKAKGPTLDVGRRMMAFNWLPAAYAHPDWLGPWAEILGQRDTISTRVIQRASLVMLERYDLRVRYLRDVGTRSWLLKSHRMMMLIASELGTAMLGGWVRSRIERQEVSRQFEVLGGAGRQDALRYTHEMHALPFCQDPGGWAVPLIGPQSVTKLGISCLAALLDDDSDGARERFTLRFSHDDTSTRRSSCLD
jgi:YOP proteins translocation protein K (YscK)